MKYKLTQLTSAILIAAFIWQSLAWEQAKGEAVLTGVRMNPNPLSPSQDKQSIVNSQWSIDNKILSTMDYRLSTNYLRPQAAGERRDAQGPMPAHVLEEELERVLSLPTFFERFQGVMKYRGLSVPELARRSGVSTDTIYKLKNRKITNQSFGTLGKIAAVLQVPLEKLVTSEKELGHALSFSTLAERLQKVRRCRGLSVLELSRRSGVLRAKIREIEAGILTTPHFNTIQRLATGLQVPAEKLGEATKVAQDGAEKLEKIRADLLDLLGAIVKFFNYYEVDDTIFSNYPLFWRLLEGYVNRAKHIVDAVTEARAQYPNIIQVEFVEFVSAIHQNLIKQQIRSERNERYYRSFCTSRYAARAACNLINAQNQSLRSVEYDRMYDRMVGYNEMIKRILDIFESDIALIENALEFVRDNIEASVSMEEIKTALIDEMEELDRIAKMPDANDDDRIAQIDSFANEMEQIYDKAVNYLYQFTHDHLRGAAEYFEFARQKVRGIRLDNNFADEAVMSSILRPRAAGERDAPEGAPLSDPEYEELIRLHAELFCEASRLEAEYKDAKRCAELFGYPDQEVISEKKKKFKDADDRTHSVHLQLREKGASLGISPLKIAGDVLISIIRSASDYEVEIESFPYALIKSRSSDTDWFTCGGFFIYKLVKARKDILLAFYRKSWDIDLDYHSHSGDIPPEVQPFKLESEKALKKVNEFVEFCKRSRLDIVSAISTVDYKNSH